MGRLRGFLWLVAGLVVAILAGAVAFIALQRGVSARSAQGEAGPTVSVVVAAKAIGVRSALTAQDLAVADMSTESVPEGALSDVSQAVGKLTLVDLFPGEVILNQRLVDPNETNGNGRLALVVAEDQVLMAFPATDLMSNLAVLKPGDHVDLLFTLDFPVSQTGTSQTGENIGTGTGAAEPSTFNLLQNVMIAAIVAKTVAEEQEAGPPQGILLTLAPQDALIVKYALDAGGKFDIVLRAPGVETPFEIEPVDIDYMIARFQIPGTVTR